MGPGFRRDDGMTVFGVTVSQAMALVFNASVDEFASGVWVPAFAGMTVFELTVPQAIALVFNASVDESASGVWVPTSAGIAGMTG
jgi:hypothetical protein